MIKQHRLLFLSLSLLMSVSCVYAEHHDSNAKKLERQAKVIKDQQEALNLQGEENTRLVEKLKEKKKEKKELKEELREVKKEKAGDIAKAVCGTAVAEGVLLGILYLIYR